MLTISHLALALPRATAFTNFRRRFQPRVVLRGMGMEQLGAVAAPGVRVRAPWRNGRLYPGQVTSVEGDTVSIKFDDGDQREGVTWKTCQVGPIDEALGPTVGDRVLAPWTNRHMYPGRVGAVSKSKDKVKINFDDGDERVVPWTACRLRDAQRTSYKRPQSLSDSLSYAGLTDSQLKPRAQPAHDGAHRPPAGAGVEEAVDRPRVGLEDVARALHELVALRRLVALQVRATAHVRIRASGVQALVARLGLERRPARQLWAIFAC